MTFGLVLLIASGALLVGFAAQRIGPAQAGFEWQIGAVGALYGELLTCGLLAVTLGIGVDSLPLIGVLLGGAIVGGLLVTAFRRFDSRTSTFAQQRQAPGPAVTRTSARLTYSPQLIDQPIVDRMRRQFGVSVSVRRTHIEGDHGWVDIELVGGTKSLDLAMALARDSGILFEPEVYDSGTDRLAA
jgi:hypothetical protein